MKIKELGGHKSKPADETFPPSRTLSSVFIRGSFRRFDFALRLP
jgi:hypothetical protein